MEALRSIVDHPYILIAALLLGLPCFVFLASLIFQNPEQDAEDDIALLSGTPMTIIGIKIVLFFFVCGAFTTMFYRVGSWIVSLL
jgi:1,4-dihydroxy-2-naphthoate octaprenyltransferase